VKTYNPDDKKPWIAALLSLVGLGLGQFFNGETAKGILFFILAIAAFIMGGPLLSVDPLLLLAVIWVIAVFDAFMSAKKINCLEKPFSRKSALFWPEVGLLAVIAVLIVFSSVFPMVTAQGVTLTAGALAETKYPEYSLPLYDAALSLAPRDTGIMMQKLAVMQGLGKSDVVQIWNRSWQQTQTKRLLLL
jgi:TM2 domain-containing membrane protein YozV